MNRQFIEQIPLVAPTKHQASQLSHLAEIISSMSYHIAEHPAQQTARTHVMLAFWERVLNGVVYELFFPDELHAANLHVVELMEKVLLPALGELSPVNRLPAIWEAFEELSGGNHPLRIGLDKLQTLDIVRVVEGKA